MKNNDIRECEEINIADDLEEFNKSIKKVTIKTYGSHSHIILRLTLIMNFCDDTRQISVANFVDLGPMNDSSSSNYHNEPLAKFERMISMVSRGNMHDVQIDSSLLTKLLHQCIGGNCKTAFVLTATPYQKQ